MRSVVSSRSAIRGPFGLVMSYGVLAVLVVGFLSSFALSRYASLSVERDEARRFEMARLEVEDLVRARLDRFHSVLRHTRAFATTKERVSRQDFRAFLEAVDLPGSYPDLQAVGFIDRVAVRHRTAHEREVREDGYPGYRVWPRVEGAPYLYPVKFLEPSSDANRRALGFDAHSEPRRAAALDRARDTGLPTLTGSLELLQDPKHPGFLLILPVYQRGMRTESVPDRRWALRGFLYAPFRASDFFGELYRSSAVFHKGLGLRARFSDGLLYDSGVAAKGPLRSVSTLPIFGQALSLEVFETAGFASPADEFSPFLVFSAGVLATLLIAFGVFLAGRHSASQREAIEMRDEFLSICSHELRTPLTSMKLQNQLVQRTLRDDLAAGNSARFEKMVQQSGRQIDRLVRLVEEMLDISRIRSGKLTLTPEEVDLSQLVRDTVERFGPQLQAAACPVRVRVPEDVFGHWDRLRLEQVLVNLLSNAIKYGPGEPIDVELLSLAGKALLTVEDRGIGIAPEHQARIFERFERASTKADIGGLGLGLYIVKQIVALMGGSIRVESRPGAGARFLVELPGAESRPRAPFTAAPVKPHREAASP